MKFFTILLLLFCSHAYSQRRPYKLSDTLRIGDSLEILYAKDSQFKILTDTLPLITTDENGGWRDMQLVTYYYDSSDMLRKILFWSREGVYYFFFDGVYLRKVRVLKVGGRINTQYYFATDDNRLTPAQMQRHLDRDPQLKELNELLEMSRTFTEKFKTLL